MGVDGEGAIGIRPADRSVYVHATGTEYAPEVLLLPSQFRTKPLG